MTMLERFFGRGSQANEFSDPLNSVYDDIDPEIARDYDAGLVEFGLLSEQEFNAEYPNSPFVPEAADELETEPR